MVFRTFFKKSYGFFLVPKKKLNRVLKCKHVRSVLLLAPVISAEALALGYGRVWGLLKFFQMVFEYHDVTKIGNARRDVAAG